MKQVSVINIEESIGKTVGRRKPPRGVRRFHTHEEAYQWILKYTVVKMS